MGPSHELRAQRNDLPGEDFEHRLHERLNSERFHDEAVHWETTVPAEPNLGFVLGIRAHDDDQERSALVQRLLPSLQHVLDRVGSVHAFAQVHVGDHEGERLQALFRFSKLRNGVLGFGVRHHRDAHDAPSETTLDQTKTRCFVIKHQHTLGV